MIPMTIGIEKWLLLKMTIVVVGDENDDMLFNVVFWYIIDILLMILKADIVFIDTIDTMHYDWPIIDDDDDDYSDMTYWWWWCDIDWRDDEKKYIYSIGSDDWLAFEEADDDDDDDDDIDIIIIIRIWQHWKAF